MKSLPAFLLALSLPCMVAAQNCSGYYYLTTGSVVMTTFDKKAKESGKITYTMSDVKNGGGTTSAHFTSEMVDEKGKSISKGAGEYRCNGGNLYVDARTTMPQEQMGAYKNMDIQADEIFIEYPGSFSNGQSLKDANVKMNVSNKGNAVSTITLDQSNRKVEGKETITTPAGSWECWKISYDSRFRATVGGPAGIGIPINFRVTEWFAPGFGIVKTETYSKNGKLLGSTLITSVTR
jgi:hypothetical protein